MARAWIFQDAKQKAKLGDKCKWSVGWLEPQTGKRRSAVVGSKSQAEKRARKIEGQIEAGTLEPKRARKSWSEFREEYEQSVLALKRSGTQVSAKHSFDNFERVVKPAAVAGITTRDIDAYKAARLTERGVKRGSKVSPATVNRELRDLRAALRKAEKWGLIDKAPQVEMLDELHELPRYVTPEDFDAIYQACKVAQRPSGEAFEPAAWWRGLLAFAYLTGWRRDEMLTLRWSEVDLDAGLVRLRAENAKGRRAAVVPLDPFVVEHLERLRSFLPNVFHWIHGDRALYSEWHRIQVAAGIHLECQDADKHECTPTCHLYGFHDLRRGFATQNALSLPPEILQTLMRHQDYGTTKRYLNLARQVRPEAVQLFVPESLKRATGG